MRKILLTIILVGLSASSFAEEVKKPLRPAYFNLSFANQQMTIGDEMALKANYGAALTIGRSFYLNKNKPVLKMIRFAIDATWFDLNYTNYKIEYRYSEQKEQVSEFGSYHQAEVGMQVGPSVTINPVSKLNIHGYFRYAPSFSALYDENSFQGGYAGFFVGGGAISYGVIGLGVETRFGGCNYSNLFGGESEDDTRNNDNTGNSDGKAASLKSKFSGMRVYITFRF